jgi:Tfp pilus assembly protein PilV
VITKLQRDEGGFGLVELILALVVLNIVILALFGIFNAGQLALARANRQLTAETIADQQMERFRAHVYASIGLDATLVAAPATTGDTRHVSDSEWVSQTAQYAAAACTATTVECQPIRTVDKSTTPASPDGRSYRVDTYVRVLLPGDAGAPASVRSTGVKRVTVVVRKGEDLTKRPLARLTTYFDQATGCNGTTAPC